MIQEMFDTIREAMFASKSEEDREDTRVAAQRVIDRAVARKRRYSENLPALRAKRFARYNTHQTAGLENWHRNKHNIIVSQTGRAITPPGNWRWVSGLSKGERQIVLNGAGTVIVRSQRPIHAYAGTPFENYMMVMAKFKGAYGNVGNCAYDQFGRSTCHGPQLVYVPRNIPEDLYHDVRRAVTMNPVDEAFAGKSEEDKEATAKSDHDEIEQYRGVSAARVAEVQAKDPKKKTPFSPAQKLFQEMVEGFIVDMRAGFARDLPDSPKYQQDTFGMDQYWFHDADGVSVDGTLYDVMNDSADYNYGQEWYAALRKAMHKIGYYIEGGGGDVLFIRENIREGLRGKVLAAGLAGAMAVSPMAASAKTLIDPGHGGTDPGAVVAQGAEKHIILPIAQKLHASLPGSWLTRDGDVAIGRTERAQAANKEGGDVFISIHANSTADPETTASGVEVLYWDGSVKGKALADALVAALDGRKAVPVTTGGRGEAVLKKTKMPAVIIELGFLNNPTDLKNIKDPKWQDDFVAKTTQVLRQQGYEQSQN